MSQFICKTNANLSLKLSKDSETGFTPQSVLGHFDKHVYYLLLGGILAIVFTKDVT